MTVFFSLPFSAVKSFFRFVLILIGLLLFTPTPILTSIEPFHAQNFRVGDCVIYDFQQSVSSVEVRSINNDGAHFVVHTATKDTAEREGFSSWSSWVKAGCPGSIAEDHLFIRNDGVIISMNSELLKTSFLSTVLSQHMTHIPDENRRKAGPKPMSGELDLRPIWQPRIIVNGRSELVLSQAFSFTWPEDESELAGRLLVIYVPVSESTVPLLPYWVESPSSSAKVTVINSWRGPAHIKP